MNPYLHALWCDDIREEARNKLAFLGVYTGSIVLGELPATLTKLCCVLTLCLPAEAKFSTFDVRILRDDGTEVAALTNLNEQNQDLPTTPDGNPASAIERVFVLVLTPMTIPAGTKWLRGQVEADGTVFESKKFWVEVGPTGGTLVRQGPTA